MTLEEKARKLQWTFYHGTGGDESELQFLERMLREWIEEEREACAQAVKKEIELWDRESIVELRESILAEIRARSS